MSPLEFLGLDETADARAVKRAYAVRLKAARPDVDPQAFQALHDAYQAANDYLRWRNRQGQGAEAQEVEAQEVEAMETPAPVVRALMEPTAINPPPPEADEVGAATPRPVPPEVWDRIDAPTDAQESQPFILHLLDFIEDLLARARNDDPKIFSDWLTGTLGDWPFSARPAAAPQVFAALYESAPDFTCAHFDAIAQAFGFDDVFARIPPLAVEQLRERLRAAEARWYDARWRARLAELTDTDERLRFLDAAVTAASSPEQKLSMQRELFVELLAANAREHLRLRLKAAGARINRVSVSLCAGLLTGSRAALRAKILRHTPFLASHVRRFLDALDGGRLEALSPAIDPAAISAWRKGTPLGKVAVGLLAILVLAARIHSAAVLIYKREADVAPAKAGRANEAIAAHDDRVANLSMDRSLIDARVTAKALSDECDQLGEAGETNRMLATANAMIARFGGHTDADIRLLVAQTMYDKGYYLLQAERHDEAIKAFDDLLASAKPTRSPLSVVTTMIDNGSHNTDHRSDDEPTRALDRIVPVLDRNDPRFFFFLRAHLQRGHALYDVGRTQEALQEHEFFLAHDPPDESVLDHERNAIAMKMRGLDLNKLGRPADAIAAWNAVEARYGLSDEFPVMAQVAASLFEMADLVKGDEALALYDLIIWRYSGQPEDRLQQAVARSRFFKGAKLTDMGRFTEARAELEGVVHDCATSPDKTIQTIVDSAKTYLANLPPPRP